jgi:tetratricopeptide (TPR) repeat protein
MKDSYKMLVLSYFHLQQFDRLIASAQMAVNQKLDDDGFFLYYLGVHAYYAKQYEPAVLYLQQSVQKSPDAAEAYYYLAMTLKAMGREPVAVAALQKAQVLENSRGTSFTDLRNVRLKIL